MHLFIQHIHGRVWFASWRTHSCFVLSCTGNKDPNAHVPNKHTSSFSNISKMSPICLTASFLPCCPSWHESKADVSSAPVLSPSPHQQNNFAQVHRDVLMVMLRSPCNPWILTPILSTVAWKRLNFGRLKDLSASARQEDCWVWSHSFT